MQSRRVGTGRIDPHAAIFTPGRFSHGQATPVPIHEEAGWAPQLASRRETALPLSDSLTIQPESKQFLTRDNVPPGQGYRTPQG
jgi:hypothetical protein